MNGGYVMLDFSGKTTGTDAIFASEITKAIATKKMIIAHNLNGQSPVVLTADANGVLAGGGVTVSVSGTTVTISTPGAGTVSDIKIISGTKTGTVSANSVIRSIVSLDIPTGYSIVGITSLAITSTPSTPSLTIRGWKMTSGNDGIEVSIGNPTDNSVTPVTTTVSVMIGKVVAEQSSKSDDNVSDGEIPIEIPIEKKTSKKGSVE